MVRRMLRRAVFSSKVVSGTWRLSLSCRSLSQNAASSCNPTSHQWNLSGTTKSRSQIAQGRPLKSNGLSGRIWQIPSSN